MKKLFFTLVLSVSVLLASAQNLNVITWFSQNGNDLQIALTYSNGTAPYACHVVIDYEAPSGLYEIVVCDTVYHFADGSSADDTTRWYVLPYSGQYRVSLRSSDAANDTSLLIFLPSYTVDTFPTGISNVMSENSRIWSYGNMITIESSDVGTVSIYNLSGQQMKSISSSTGTTTVDAAGWTAGMYLVRLSTEKGDLVKKVVVN